MNRKHLVLLTLPLLLILGCLSVANQARADGWTYVSGTAGAIESPGNTEWNRINPQGIDLEQKENTTNRIHIPLPTPTPGGAAKASKIQLQIYQASSDIAITGVTLLSAAYTIVQLPAVAYGGDGVHYRWIELSLGGAYDFTYGAGITISISAGANTSVSHRFCVAGAGVYWITSSTATAVELSSFSARPSSKGVKLKWETAQETDNVGFHLLRSAGKKGKYTRITDAVIPSNGSPWDGAAYSYMDKEAPSGKVWFYKLMDVDYSGKKTLYGPVSTHGLDFSSDQVEGKDPAGADFEPGVERVELTEVQPEPPPYRPRDIRTVAP